MVRNPNSFIRCFLWTKIVKLLNQVCIFHMNSEYKPLIILLQWRLTGTILALVLNTSFLALSGSDGQI